MPSIEKPPRPFLLLCDKTAFQSDLRPADAAETSTLVSPALQAGSAPSLLSQEDERAGVRK